MRGLLAIACAFGLAACQSVSSPTAAEVGTACDIAVRLRDQWLRENVSAESAILQRGEIVTVQRLGPAHSRMWHVTFLTETGDQPEGMHMYYLQVHFVVAGTDVQVLQIERGPDEIT